MPIFSTGIGIFRRELNLFRVSTIGLPSHVIIFLSTRNLPKFYQKTWFFMIFESCCNSVLFNFWCSKSSKNRAKKGTKDHKRDQSTSTIYKLKIPRGKTRTGSSPVSGTRIKALRSFLWSKSFSAIAKKLTALKRVPPVILFFFLFDLENKPH